MISETSSCRATIGRLGGFEEQFGTAHGIVDGAIEAVVELEVLRQQAKHCNLIGEFGHRYS